MNVIVDTSVWSLALSRTQVSEAREVKWLKQAIESGQPIALLGVILLELLQGVKDRQRFIKLQNDLSNFQLLDVTRTDYIFAAEISNLCRSKGITASTIDVLIAAVAINNDCQLLSADREFLNISSVAPIKLVQWKSH